MAKPVSAARRETVCDALLDIPMAPHAIQSLNASVAGALVLYEAFKQRQHQKGLK